MYGVYFPLPRFFISSTTPAAAAIDISPIPAQRAILLSSPVLGSVPGFPVGRGVGVGRGVWLGAGLSVGTAVGTGLAVAVGVGDGVAAGL